MLKKLKIIIIILKIFGLAPANLIKNKILKKYYDFYRFFILILFIFNYIYTSYVTIFWDQIPTMKILDLFQKCLGLIYFCIQTHFIGFNNKKIVKIFKLLNQQQKYFEINSLIPKQLKILFTFFILITLFTNIFNYFYSKHLMIFAQISDTFENLYTCFIYILLHINTQKFKIFNKNLLNKNYKIKHLLKRHNKLLNTLKLIKNTFSIIIFYCCFWNLFSVSDTILYFIFIDKRRIEINLILKICLTFAWLLIKLLKLCFFFQICVEACKTVRLFK